MAHLDSSVVLVTGANGGLGAEFVRQALARGASRVYATARRPTAWQDPRIVPLALDVTDAESVTAAAAIATDVTVLVNNAGIASDRSLLRGELDAVRKVFETNVFAPLAVARAFAPVLAANGGGALVDVHSALSWYAAAGAYSASKAALWSITNSLRLELAGQGTQVVGVHLGYADTPMTAGLDVPKTTPEYVVGVVYDGVESGEHEVLADDTSRRIKAALAGPIEELYPQLGR